MDDKTLGRIRRRLDLDSSFMDDCQAYNDMDDLKWNMPKGFKEREEIRKRVSTDAHDILKTAVNLFDTHHPKWQILPRGPEDSDAVEELERWLEWQMMIADQQGDKPSSSERLKHAAKYGRIACQLDFLPYWTPESSEEYKDSLAHPFCVTVHNPSNIHFERGKYGLRWVANVSLVPAADCIDHWDAYQNDGEYGKKISAAIKKVEALLEDDDEAQVMYVDYIDKEKRWCFAYLADHMDEDLEIPKDGLIEFVNGENKLGFINWAISEAATTPLLYSLHKGGLYENQCFLDTIADTTVIRRGWFPLIKHKSVSGKSLEVDFTGTEAVIELNAADGEEAEILTPPPLDPGIREMMDRNSQKSASATGLKGLQNMNLVGNVQYASVEAMIQVSKSTLDPYLTCYQHNAVELAKLAFLWIQKSGISIVGQRLKDKKMGKMKGEKIIVTPDKFDLKTMLIQCELLTNQTGDELQRMNVFSQAKQIGLHLPDSEILERMSWGAPEVLESQWLKEQMQNMALANFKAMQDLQIQMMAQQAQMAQAQAQQPPQGISPPDKGGGQPMISNADGLGNDPNQGGQPSAMSAPSMTQTKTRRP